MSIRSHLGLKTAAVMLAAGGLGVGLIGSGVRASFTDSATASESVSVGTMGITISSSTAGAMVVNTGNQGTHTVTFTCQPINSSLAGSCPLDFKVTNSGTMSETVTVASNGGSPAFAAPWSDNFTNPGPQVLATAGASYDYTGGIAWGALSNSDLGSAHSVTYTISASA
jgi:predicted ribosomally synthesized peptide with SipW-like signal peptide